MDPTVGLKNSLVPTRKKKLAYILIYIQQVATLHSLFYLETALHVSSVTSTHHQERIQLYLQHLVFVRPLLLPSHYSGSNSSNSNTDADTLT